MSSEFGLHLKQCGIVSQLTPPGTPQRNAVSERRNRTLLDIMRYMMSLTDLPLSFWGYALETTAFTLNRLSSESIEMTPYELWFCKKPKLSFLKVWGCDTYVKRLQPDKVEPKLDKCVFIGYPKETIGYTYLMKHKSETFEKFKEFLMTHKYRGSQPFSISKSVEPNEELKVEQIFPQVLSTTDTTLRTLDVHFYLEQVLN